MFVYIKNNLFILVLLFSLSNCLNVSENKPLLSEKQQYILNIRNKLENTKQSLEVSKDKALTNSLKENDINNLNLIIDGIFKFYENNYKAYDNIFEKCSVAKKKLNYDVAGNMNINDLEKDSLKNFVLKVSVYYNINKEDILKNNPELEDLEIEDLDVLIEYLTNFNLNDLNLDYGIRIDSLIKSIHSKRII